MQRDMELREHRPIKEFRRNSSLNNEQMILKSCKENFIKMFFCIFFKNKQINKNMLQKTTKNDKINILYIEYIKY